jgi:hypothetical protein
MKATKFMSAEEKEKVLKDWQRFIESDFSQAKFTKSLYNHLIQHCSFIAHYNQAGFYGTYFEDPEDTMKFITQFDREQGGVSVEYGMKYWLTAEDYQDINKAMVEAMERYKAAIYPKLRKKAKAKKLAEIERLKSEIEGYELVKSTRELTGVRYPI